MPPSFECPVLLSTFTDPVILFPSGNTFNLDAIVSWYRALQTDVSQPLSDPCTRQLCMTRVVPNWLARKQMHECGLGDSLVHRVPGDEVQIDLREPEGYAVISAPQTVDEAMSGDVGHDLAFGAGDESRFTPARAVLPHSIRAGNFITIYRMQGPAPEGPGDHVREILGSMLPSLEIGMVDSRPLQYMAARAE